MNTTEMAARTVPGERGPEQRLRLRIDGDRSREKYARAETLLGKQPGVTAVCANASTGQVEIRYRAEETSPSCLIPLLEAEGWPVGAESVRLRIRGMHCASCVAGIEKALREVPGVLEADVSPGTESADVEYVLSVADLAAVREAIEDRGYEVDEDPGVDAPDGETEERARAYRDLMRRFWFGVAISIPVLLTAWPGWVPGLRQLSMDSVRWIWGIGGLLTLSVLFYSARSSPARGRRSGTGRPT